MWKEGVVTTVNAGTESTKMSGPGEGGQRGWASPLDPGLTEISRTVLRLQEGKNGAPRITLELTVPRGGASLEGAAFPSPNQKDPKCFGETSKTLSASSVLGGVVMDSERSLGEELKASGEGHLPCLPGECLRKVALWVAGSRASSWFSQRELASLKMGAGLAFSADIPDASSSAYCSPSSEASRSPRALGPLPAASRRPPCLALPTLDMVSSRV